MTYLKEFATQAEYDAFVESGAMAKPNVSLVNEPFGTFYNKYVQHGVYIQHIDGTLYTTDQWDAEGYSSDNANGVAVVTGEASFVISPNNIGQFAWSPREENVDGVFTSDVQDVAVNDFNGYGNTLLIQSKYESGAAVECANYTFRNGKKGYLPAIGEWDIVVKNYSEIKSAMTKIGGSLPSGEVWSSTQYNNYSCWYYYRVMGSTVHIQYGRKNKTYYVLPFTTLD